MEGQKVWFFHVTFAIILHSTTSSDKLSDKFRSFLVNAENFDKNLKESIKLNKNLREEIINCNEINKEQQEQINELNQTISNLQEKLKGMLGVKKMHF